MDVINNRMDNKIKHPVGMPNHQQDFAIAWMKFLEPRMKYEIATEKLDPYQERIVDCLIIFYKLSKSDQEYLNKLRSEGIYWRGDSIEFMKKREKVTPEYLADKDKLRNMLKSMIVRMA